MGMKQMLHWHYWVLEPPHQPESLLIHTQTLQYHMSLGVGRGKEQQPNVHPAAHPAPQDPALSPAGFSTQEHSIPSRAKLCHSLRV